MRGDDAGDPLGTSDAANASDWPLHCSRSAVFPAVPTHCGQGTLQIYAQRTHRSSDMKSKAVRLRVAIMVALCLLVLPFAGSYYYLGRPASRVGPAAIVPEPCRWFATELGRLSKQARGTRTTYAVECFAYVVFHRQTPSNLYMIYHIPFFSTTYARYTSHTESQYGECLFD